MRSPNLAKLQLSIIIPVFNVEKYITRAIKSCIHQNFKNLEIIIVDDCGSDESINIAYEFAKADQRIKIIHNPKNLKLLQTRLEGVKVATSDYIMFLDSDDYLDCLICEKIAQMLEQSQNLDLLCFGMLIEKKDKFIKVDYGIESDFIALSRNDYFELVLQSGKCNWNLCGKVFKKEIYLKTLENLDRSINLNMAEDALVYFQMLFYISNILILNQNGYFYCSNTESLTNNPDLEKKIHNINEEKEVIEHILQKLPTIQDENFFQFTKAMLKDLEFYHQYRKNTLPRSRRKTSSSKILMMGKNKLASLIHKLHKKIKKSPPPPRHRLKALLDDSFPFLINRFFMKCRINCFLTRFA